MQDATLCSDSLARIRASHRPGLAQHLLCFFRSEAESGPGPGVVLSSGVDRAKLEIGEPSKSVARYVRQQHQHQHLGSSRAKVLMPGRARYRGVEVGPDFRAVKTWKVFPRILPSSVSRSLTVYATSIRYKFTPSSKSSSRGSDCDSSMVSPSGEGIGQTRRGKGGAGCLDVDVDF